MTRPWDGEIEITPEAAANLVRSQFPSIPATRVSILGRGWDNLALLIDDALVFRFPRKASAAALIETEARVLPRLRARLPLRIPEPEWVGRPSMSYPWPFLGYRRLPGRPACAVHAPRSVRTRNAPILGEFLACLHAIPSAGLGLPRDTLSRTDFSSRMPRLVEGLAVLRSEGLIPSPDPWLALFQNLEPAPHPGPAVIVHGDLYAAHLLVDEAGLVTGVIDWGDVHAGDPAVDLMVLYEFLPAPARPAFLASYGAADDEMLRAARLRAAFHAMAVAWYGIEQGDADLVREGRHALQFVLED